MPGPCNIKKKKKQQTKREKKGLSARPSLDSQVEHDDPPPPVYEPERVINDLNDLCPEYDAYEPYEPPQPYEPPEPYRPLTHESDDDLLPSTPNIYDPGNGPRVRNARAFLSSFFAQPPSLDDPLCAEFAQEEILQMLCTVLPEETAVILWYNKSRTTGRLCPSCRRLYNLGDVLPDLVQDGAKYSSEPCSPYLSREQEISGLCSPLCFIMASFNHPGAIKTTWGRAAEEIDDYTWSLLNGPGVGTGDQGLSMLMKMARLPDLGLGQLCLPDVDFDSEGEAKA
ncbi:hypothetical protein HYDPIDRAFT_177122 [Hydnomerulius pinastri MD-312]|uniref:Uncharacterized protein n=1 Tax=Hydnomerulius pinastri MD-312 TaxID=994086 RepID=A0A0C9VTF6_9AGAM|nr:hypothetical protein HYDPIDRAFT_177122 [Hydnomerulius pinastri MD-312]